MPELDYLVMPGPTPHETDEHSGFWMWFCHWLNEIAVELSNYWSTSLQGIGIALFAGTIVAENVSYAAIFWGIVLICIGGFVKFRSKDK